MVGVGGRAALTQFSGRFFRCVPEERAGDPLAPPGPESAGRYHRPGQPTLYMSSRPDWAAVAVSGYAREDGVARVLMPLDVGPAWALDQRNAEACRRLGIDPELSDAGWRAALAAGAEPPSWRNADAARAAGADGIVDRSRLIPGGWHLNLFRWNALGGPSVRVCGEAVPVRYAPGGPKWGP